VEMALTGVPGQVYPGQEPGVSKVYPLQVYPNTQGTFPAFLVYYSPAFIRLGAQEDALVAIRMLAAILRAARSLYPFDDSEEAPQWVTIHIGEIRMLLPSQVAKVHERGSYWVLRHTSRRDAVVERRELTAVVTDASPFRVLPFWSEWMTPKAAAPAVAKA